MCSVPSHFINLSLVLSFIPEKLLSHPKVLTSVYQVPSPDGESWAREGVFAEPESFTLSLVTRGRKRDRIQGNGHLWFCTSTTVCHYMK